MIVKRSMIVTMSINVWERLTTWIKCTNIFFYHILIKLSMSIECINIFYLLFHSILCKIETNFFFNYIYFFYFILFVFKFFWMKKNYKAEI